MLENKNGMMISQFLCCWNCEKAIEFSSSPGFNKRVFLFMIQNQVGQFLALEKFKN